MIKKTKTKLLVALAATSSVALAATTIACSSSPSPGSGFAFDIPNINVVRFANTFAKEGVQRDAIRAIIDKYNSLETKPEDYIKVEEVNVAGGYDKGDELTLSNITGRNTQTYWNLILNYPALAAKVAQQNMLLPLDTDGSLGDHFEEDFLTKTVGGANSKVTNVLPFGTSSVVSGVNGPMMSYILREVVKAGATYNSDADKTFFETNFTNKYKDPEEDAFIKDGKSGEKGGGYGSIADADKSVWTNYKIKQTMFDNFKDLIDFGTKVFDSFSGLKNSSTNIDNARGFVGVNSMFNWLTTFSYTQTGSLSGHVLDTEGNKNNFTNYKNMFGEGKEGKKAKQYEWLKKVYDETLSPAIAKGVLWVGGFMKTGGKEDASTFLANHQQVILNGSTSRWKNSSVPAPSGKTNDPKTLQANEVVALKAPSKYVEGDPKAAYYRQGPHILGIHANEKADKGVRAFIKWMTSTENRYDWTVKDKTYTQLTPQEMFFAHASYIVVQKGFAKEGSEIRKIIDADSNTNLYQKVTISQFAKVLESKTDQFEAFAEPTDSSTSSLRTAFETVLNTQKTSKKSATKLDDFETFIASLKSTFGTDKIK
ncbi:P68 family surface lipoprotein [Mycoplasmopsis agassizii]|uniref:Lipoprotein n=1 Tax=Mycoplasmopsis agassizii TaxID=33922 RepID=A0ABX4H4F8_9BACT|nr:P80 family lipoprotein [Mycoplasmopsis agassizii]PAF54781.1 hypothetical protein CJF60_03525 [Mycoplasmopsis agassizii]SMC19623.1 MG185/MG260 protein [Mycoplasmopsis agassizii]